MLEAPSACLRGLLRIGRWFSDIAAGGGPPRYLYMFAEDGPLRSKPRIATPKSDAPNHRYFAPTSSENDEPDAIPKHTHQEVTQGMDAEASFPRVLARCLMYYLMSLEPYLRTKLMCVLRL